MRREMPHKVRESPPLIILWFDSEVKKGGGETLEKNETHRHVFIRSSLLIQVPVVFWAMPSNARRFQSSGNRGLQVLGQDLLTTSHDPPENFPGSTTSGGGLYRRELIKGPTKFVIFPRGDVP